jgi:DNA replication ATP-dependent helicase Dna2
VNVRGPIVEVGDTRTVDTQYGESDLAEVTIRPDRGAGAPTEVTLWGKWTDTAEIAAEGMELLVTNADTDEYRGETSYSTSGDSYVVLEPDFLVDVTDVRSWVQCPRMYYLNKLSGIPLNYPVVKGTVVHEVFGDLLRGVDIEKSIDDRVAEAGLELGLLGRTREEVADEVRRNASAIEGWLEQGVLTDEDEWRSEQTLVSPTFGIKGRADAVRRGMPVELKTGKNTNRKPRFQDKIQAACYALLLEERGIDVDTGTLLYTKNAALDRAEADGDLSPAKEFTVGDGLLNFVVRTRNEIAAMEFETDVPTGYEADAKCEYCFEQDTCMVVSGRLDQESKAGQVGRAVPPEERDYFEQMYRALEAERGEIHAEYRKLWEQSAEERADDDRALIGLDPLDRAEREGGRWELTAGKPAETVSKLREGDIALASDGDPVGGDAELARIEQLGGRGGDAEEQAAASTLPADRELIVVSADEPLELCRLDVYPFELSVDRQLTALHDAVLKGSEKRKDVLFGRREPEFATESTTFIDNNDAQNRAVQRAVAAEDFALIHGPPGTGKTYTIARTVRALVERGNRVLLSAFTNRAVDNVLDALREQGVADAVGAAERHADAVGQNPEFTEAVVRVGSEQGVRGDMQDVRLVERGEPHDRATELSDAPVVAATTAACGSRTMREQSFDVALVDEASQLTEPGTLAAINRADRFVLVGDHEQLPPVVQAEGGERWDAQAETDDEAAADTADTARADLATSLFERLIDRYPDASVLLTSQYRMSQRIQAFASAEFYDGALRPATAGVAGRSLEDLGVETAGLPSEIVGGVSFVDPDGERVGNTNPAEAQRIAEVVQQYVAGGVDPADIGVIAPFRAQVAEISKLTDVTVDTVDRFQGSSKEVIVVSFVATGSLDSPIFEDHRRVNVALTRAKRALTLVGDETALRSDDFYERMLEWADR